MTILFKEPGAPCEVREIPNELEAMQELVGGYIETLRLDGDLFFIVNEDGKMLGLTPNVVAPNLDILVGPVLIVADGCDGDFRALTDEEIEFCKEYLTCCEV